MPRGSGRTAARHRSPFLACADRADWTPTRLVDAGSWDALADSVLPHEEALPWVGPLVRGVAAARTSWARQDAALQARARAELTRLEQLAREAGPISEEERARLLVQGAMAGAQYERDEMQLLLDGRARSRSHGCSAGDHCACPVVLAWELQADLLRVTDRYAAASRSLPRPAGRMATPRAGAHRPGQRVSAARLHA